MNIANHAELLVNRTYDELSVGETASLVRLVRADDVKLFAAESGDVNPAHLDPYYAATDIFGHIVIHGMWTAGLISTLLGTKLPGPGTIYLDQNLHFRKPVAPGDTVTAYYDPASPGSAFLITERNWLVYVAFIVPVVLAILLAALWPRVAGQASASPPRNA